MSKFIRQLGLVLLLLGCSLGLAACGSEGESEIAPYSAARPLTIDKSAEDSVKTALKGVKGVKVETFAFKDDPIAVKTYYETKFKELGWLDQKEKIAEVAKQQNPSGWALTYEKGGKVMSLVMTPGTMAAPKFPEAQGDNVLVILSATK